MDQEKLWKDPIMEEVRRARRAHASKFGNALAAIAKDLKRHERETGSNVVSLPPKLL
ncbi:MAG: hypothetical protein WD423_07865 [Rhodothermales bacterium]